MENGRIYTSIAAKLLIMPILRELYDKSVLLIGKSVGLKKATTLLLDKNINLPRVPEKRKSTTEDVTNHAHLIVKKRNEIRCRNISI